jgi:hypothetical protein
MSIKISLEGGAAEAHAKRQHQSRNTTGMTYTTFPNFGPGTKPKYQLKMDKQSPFGVSDYSSSKTSEGRQNSSRADKSHRAARGSNVDGCECKERDGEQEDGSGVSDYSPRPRHPTASEYLDSGEEGSHSPTSPRYSPTSPRYLRPDFNLAVSDYSSGEERYDGTSDMDPRKARRLEHRQQREGVATDDSEPVKAGCALQRERLKIAWDTCTVACLVVGIVVFVELPKLLDAVVGLIDQKTESLRFEHSANCDAGR